MSAEKATSDWSPGLDAEVGHETPSFIACGF
jgi:hypothetical protein